MNLSLLFLLLTSVAASTGEWTFSWNESKKWNKLRDTKLSKIRKQHQNVTSEVIGSDLVNGLPVYISLTTIANRLHLLAPTIESIVAGSVLPTMIYVFISSDPYLIDTGIKEKDLFRKESNLVPLIDQYPNIKFVSTENIGPHRKLLPLLSHKMKEDCIIITVDDDHLYPGHWLRDMLAYYVHSEGQAIISSRARRIAMCSGGAPYEVAPYMHYADPFGMNYQTQWHEVPPHINEMLLLPTGVGGVLYRPRFFNTSILFDRAVWSLTPKADDLTFRIATLANAVSVYSACIFGDFKDNQLITQCPTLRVDFSHIQRKSSLGNTVRGITNYEASIQEAKIDHIQALYSSSGEIYRGTGSHNLRRRAAYSAQSLFATLPDRNLRSSFGFTKKRRHRTVNNNNNNITDITSRNIDHGDKGSLSSINSKTDGNFNQWSDAVNYLEINDIFDLNAALQPYVLAERLQCATTKVLLTYNKRTFLGVVIGTVVKKIQSIAEYTTNDKCGIVSCEVTPLLY